MKKLSLLVSLVVLGILLATGVALAANIQCTSAPKTCYGTSENDVIAGSEKKDRIRSKSGDDRVSGLDEKDYIVGGTGADNLSGGADNDELISAAVVYGGASGKRTVFTDGSNDIVRGGPGNDTIYGGFGKGGVDEIFGDRGRDLIYVDQRFFRSKGAKTKITREIVVCGPGEDLVTFDRGVDKVDRDTCEKLYPTGSDGQTPNLPKGNRTLPTE